MVWGFFKNIFIIFVIIIIIKIILSLANYESKAVGCVRVTDAIVQMGFPNNFFK